MSKYRVKYIGGKYWPQKRELLLWWAVGRYSAGLAEGYDTLEAAVQSCKHHAKVIWEGEL